MGTTLISHVQTPPLGAAAITPKCAQWPHPPWPSETVWPFPTGALWVDGAKVAIASRV